MKIIIGFIISVALVIGGFWYLSSRTSAPAVLTEENVPNVSIVDGKQIIRLTAKGGYFPLKSTAKAGIPTVLQVSTNGTFDCSSSLRIPEKNITKNLPPTGVTEVDLGVPEAGLFQGTCSMGMYPFEIDFQGS
ncbi:MAG: hypothetical protein A2808_03980 [Candidatus Moranbacteria bacterium RIFCSPHIGHO2_01_FULL_55_24]|nr:MAG: hypothetical protein A2808_03980 [Candidatus Moranbacteria bacterium RIFCSPHIGHO2_01_FULL_55_24]